MALVIKDGHGLLIVTASVNSDDLAYWLIRLQEVAVFGDSALMEEGLGGLLFLAVIVNSN
jgi:hypothetical protein